MRSIAIIFNNNSGVSDRLDEIKEYYAELPEDLFRIEIWVIEEEKELLRAVEKYKAGEWDVIVAAGGDGTVSAVAHVLWGSNNVLGVLPLGTFNHFAKDMNIPLALIEALDIVTHGNKVRNIDVAECNGVTFINNSSLGVYPKIIELRERLQKNGGMKWTAFAVSALRVLRNMPKITVTLESAGKKIVRHTSFIFIGNNQYRVEGAKLGTREDLSSGKLSLWVTRTTTAFGLFNLALRMLTGKIDEEKDLQTLRLSQVTVETPAPDVLVSFDGEVTRMKNPLRYKIIPQALRVIVA